MSLDVYIKSKKKEEDREWVANITHKNGWGSYDLFLKFLIKYKEACEDHPGYIIEASR